MRRQRIGEASLACQEALRERLLPDLLGLTRAGNRSDRGELEAMIARHRATWLDRQFPPEDLPPRILMSNLGAYTAHAVDDLGTRAPGLAEELWRAWLGPGSMFGNAIRRTENEGAGHAIRYKRRVCCLRDYVSGVPRCHSCPKLKA